MKKFISLILAPIALFAASPVSVNKLYIAPDHVVEVNGTPVIKDFLPLGIKQPLRKDKEGYYIYERETVALKKGKFEYHYCPKCDQEFTTRRSYKDHVCRRGYYDRQDGGYRICDHYRGIFDRPSEFNR